MGDPQIDQGLQEQVSDLRQKLKQATYLVDEEKRKAEKTTEECCRVLGEWIVQHANPSDVRSILQSKKFTSLVAEAEKMHNKEKAKIQRLSSRVKKSDDELSAVAKHLQKAEEELKCLSDKLDQSDKLRRKREEEYDVSVQRLQTELEYVRRYVHDGGRLQNEVNKLSAELKELKGAHQRELVEKEKKLKDKVMELGRKEDEILQLNNRLRSLEALQRVSVPSHPCLPPADASLPLRPRNEFGGATADLKPEAISFPSSDEPLASAELVSVAKDAFGNAAVAVLFGDGRLAVYSLTKSEILLKGTIELHGQFNSILLFGVFAEDCYALGKDGDLGLYNVTGGGGLTSQTSSSIQITSVTANFELGEDTVVVAFRNKNPTNAAPKIGELNLLNEDTPSTVFVNSVPCDAHRIGFNQSGTRFAAFDARRIVVYSVEENEYKLLYKTQAAIGVPLGVGILNAEATMIGVVTRQLQGFTVRAGPSDGRVESRVLKMEGLDLGRNLYVFSTPCPADNGHATVWAFVAKDNKIHVRKSDNPNSDSHLLSYHEAPITVLIIDQSSTLVVSGDEMGRLALWHV